MCHHLDMKTIVVDTNIFVSALLNPAGACGETMARCFQQRYHPLMGTSLYLEYEDLLSRQYLFTNTLTSPKEREQFFDDFLSICRWVKVYYSWRPNLKDEADNHLIELAVAGGADAIITKNIKDFRQSNLLFPEISILNPFQTLETK